VVSSLLSRLEDIPGVASVVVDLEGFGRGIDVRLQPGADEIAVMEQMHALLAAYGVRSDRQPEVKVGRARPAPVPGVAVRITPAERGARIEVATKSVRSFRVVAATPISVAQGLADAWCQVVGRIPLEIVDVSVDSDGRLTVVASDGENETRGVGQVADGWRNALTRAVAGVIGEVTEEKEAAVSF
jgi:hypothetical protein